MATTINIGDDPNQPADDTVALDVPAGATVNVLVASGAAVNYWNAQNPDDTSQSGTIANAGNQNFTTPSFLESQGFSTITLTGGNY